MYRLVSIVCLLFTQITIKLTHIGVVIVESIDTSTFNASYPTYMTTPFTNGCYKRRIIEPDLWNSARFFETEELICPAGVNASTFAMLTQQLQNNNSANHMFPFIPANNTPIAGSAVPAKTFMDFPHNISYVALPAFPAESNAVAFKPSLIATPSASHPVGSTVEHQQPFVATATKPNATAHVAVLSKKTVFYDREKKKSCANFLNNFDWLFVFVVMLIFMN